jgi:soluble lytic murein transglycosylase
VGKVMSQPPTGDSLALWRVVFPQAYRPLIDDVANKAELPPAFVRAIAREESSFDPNAVSPANAYGLIQLIRSTARAYAQPIGLPSDPDSLKKPEVNLRIGAAFMRHLWERYRTNPAVIPSAYNAGPGATDRWLRERGKLPLDEWVETIPYTETRRYTRRVLQSYGVYAWLDEGVVPPLPKTLPQM